MGFFRKEYWSGLSFPSPEGLPDSGIELWSPTLQADSLPSEAPGKPKYMDLKGKSGVGEIGRLGLTYIHY